MKKVSNPGRIPADGPTDDTVKGEPQAANVANSYPTGIQLESGEKPLENNPVSKVSNYKQGIGWGSVECKLDPHKFVNTSHRATIGQSWIPRIPPGQPAGSKSVLVALGEADSRGVNHRVGETHHHAILSDAQVEQMRDEYEAHPAGHPDHVGYRVLAAKWNVSKRTVRDICNYSRRNAWAARFKRVEG